MWDNSITKLRVLSVSQWGIHIAWDFKKPWGVDASRDYGFTITMRYESEKTPRYTKFWMRSFDRFALGPGPGPGQMFGQQSVCPVLPPNNDEGDDQPECIKFEETFPESLPTGTYHLDVSVEQFRTSIKVVVPTVGALCNGASSFLIDGSLFGVDHWCVLTNHHALNTKVQAANTKVIFNSTCMANLKPDIFWATHTNQGANGLDYTCIAIDHIAKANLTALKMFPNRLIGNPKECHSTMMLIHKPAQINKFVYTLCRMKKHQKVKTKYDYLGCETGPGSSGSPLFGIFNNSPPIGFEDNIIGICGLHKAKNLCVNIRDILEDLKKQTKEQSSSSN
jgi:hypothetical protein